MKEEVETWDYLFKLSRRYKETICHEHIGLGWHRRLYETARRRDDPTYSESEVADFLWYAKNNPLDNLAFLHAPFLKACLDKGLF